MRTTARQGIKDQMVHIEIARLSGEGKTYFIQNSTIDDYDLTFSAVLRGKRIADLLRGNSSPVVIDLMSDPGPLVDLFRRASPLGISPTLGFGIALSYVQFDDVPQNNIVSIGSDILTFDTWQSIATALGGRKASLIMERAIGGVANVPNNGAFFGITLRRAWRLLDPNGGALLFQTPPYNDFISSELWLRISHWVAMLNSQRIPARTDDEYTAIHLTRLPQSPAKLPMLE